MTVTTVVDARTNRIGHDAAWNLLKGATSIITTKGEKVQSWNPQNDAKTEILLAVMGPSGNLRAPTLRYRDEFIIGFNADLYESWFGKI